MESDNLQKTIKSIQTNIMEVEEQVQESDEVSPVKDNLMEKYKTQYKEGKYL